MKRLLFALIAILAIGCEKESMSDTYLASVFDGDIELVFYNNGDVLATHKATGDSDWGHYEITEADGGSRLKLTIKLLYVKGPRYYYRFSSSEAFVAKKKKDRNSIYLKSQYNGISSTEYYCNFKRTSR